MVNITSESPWNRKESDRCCFCRERTDKWYEPKDVACCDKCAIHANEYDFPSKREWLRREAIADGKTSYYRR